MQRRSFFQALTGFFGFFFGNRTISLETLWPRRTQLLGRPSMPVRPKVFGPWMTLAEPKKVVMNVLLPDGKVEQQEATEVAHLTNIARSRSINIANEADYEKELGKPSGMEDWDPKDAA